MPKEKKTQEEDVLWDIQKPADITAYPKPTEGLVRDSKGRITHGSKGLNTRYTLQEIEERFLLALEAAYRGEIYSIHDAMQVAGLLPSTFYRYCKDYEHLGEVKEAINSATIGRINREAIQGKLQPVVSIFRMKVMGDRDKDDTTLKVVQEQPIINLD